MFRAVVQLKTVVEQNIIETKQQNRKALKTKRGFPVVSRHARNPPTEVGQPGQEHAGVTVYYYYSHASSTCHQTSAVRAKGN